MVATLFFLGRLIFGAFFIYNGYNHLANQKSLIGYAKHKNVPMAEFSVVFSGIMLMVGGASLITSYYPIFGIVLLLIFMIPTTFMMHKFWDIQDPTHKMNERIAFMKNMAIIGALLMAFSLPWPMLGL